mmetsp:Transcript_25764/g.79258  ORF Transcript_25764/g.79258 Transcript_25764/m.79258 type:complete len:438 (+) Transcript_25764:443-1756(+)
MARLPRLGLRQNLLQLSLLADRRDRRGRRKGGDLLRVGSVRHDERPRRRGDGVREDARLRRHRRGLWPGRGSGGDAVGGIGLYGELARCGRHLGSRRPHLRRRRQDLRAAPLRQRRGDVRRRQEESRRAQGRRRPLHRVAGADADARAGLRGRGVDVAAGSVLHQRRGRSFRVGGLRGRRRLRRRRRLLATFPSPTRLFQKCGPRLFGGGRGAGGVVASGAAAVVRVGAAGLLRVLCVRRVLARRQSQFPPSRRRALVSGVLLRRLLRLRLAVRLRAVGHGQSRHGQSELPGRGLLRRASRRRQLPVDAAAHAPLAPGRRRRLLDARPRRRRAPRSSGGPRRPPRRRPPSSRRRRRRDEGHDAAADTQVQRPAATTVLPDLAGRLRRGPRPRERRRRRLRRRTARPPVPRPRDPRTLPRRRPLRRPPPRALGRPQAR